MADKGRVFTGARARLQINGVPVGYATGCNGGETLEYARLKVLNNIQTKEHVAVDYDVSFSAEMVRIVGETVKSKGIFPKVGSNSDEHLKNILDQDDLTILIEDSITNALIMTLEQAKCTTNRFQVAAVGIVGFNNDFVGIRIRDESEV